MTVLSDIRQHFRTHGSITRPQLDWLFSRAEVASLLEDRTLVRPPWTDVAEDLVARAVSAVETAVERLPTKPSASAWMQIAELWRALIETVGELP